MGPRRVILKPAGLSAGDASRLAELLREAIAFQQELAAWSPHVLRFVGNLGETDDGTAFFVEHEPAVVTPYPNPFDPDVPRVDQQHLFGLSAALMHALHTVHRSQREGANAHGGLCPGVVLLSPDNVVKITDFGFASAVCSTLGSESYLNLAVRPGGPGVDDAEATGTWEVLPDHQFDRDDRICGFVDPEKYRVGNMEGFEPGSDVIAAAFLLYLWSEGRHPYLQDYPEAHRLVGMSEYMTMLIHRSYGESFRQSDDPAGQRWCQLLDRMLARLPAERPSAAEATLALAEVGITPHKNAKLPTPEDVEAQKEKPAARSSKRLKAFAAVAAVVVLGAVGAILTLMPQGTTNDQGTAGPAAPGPEVAVPLAEPTGPEEAEADIPPPSPLAIAVGQLREALAASSVLAEAADRLVPDQPAGEEDPPTLTYQLAGLPDAQRSLVLQTTDPDAGPSLSAEQIEAVRNDFAPLEALLKLEVQPAELIADLTADWAGTPLADLVDGTRIKLLANTPPVWRLTSLNDRWRASGVAFRVMFVASAEAADDAPEIELALVELGLRLMNGQVGADRMTEDLRADFRRQVEAKLLELQSASLGQRTQELAEASAAIGAEVASEPTAIEAAIPGARIIVTAESLRPRTFDLTWSPADLHFTFAPTRQRRMAEMLLAHAALPVFNDTLPDDHWIRRVSSGEAFEAAEPADGTWKLGIPALWAPQDASGLALDVADLLPIPVPWPADAQDAETIADLALAAEAPPYWALLDDYRRYAADPFFLVNVISDPSAAVVDAAEHQRLADSPVATFLTAQPQPQYVLPRTEVSGKPALLAESAGAAPTALELPVRASWALQDAPPEVDRDQLAAAVEGLANLPALSVTLNLSGENEVQLTGITALARAFEPSRAGAAALEGRIGLLAIRQSLDAELQQLLPSGTDQVSITGNALETLRKIWRAKGAPERADLRDLQALSAVLRARGGLRFEKTPPGRSELILPTILVEFFCGPQFCYAVVWSAGTDTLADVDHVTVDQPTLLRLCPSEEVFTAARGDTGAAADPLGDRLFTPVFSVVPNAATIVSSDYFPFHLGLALALDEAMWLIPGLEDLRFASQETYLRDILRADSDMASKRWATLQELRDGNDRSDFVLVRSLSAPPPPAPPGPGERAAIDTLVRAAAPTR